jgi:hypothetical protein
LRDPAKPEPSSSSSFFITACQRTHSCVNSAVLSFVMYVFLFELYLLAVNDTLRVEDESLGWYEMGLFCGSDCQFHELLLLLLLLLLLKKGFP